MKYAIVYSSRTGNTRLLSEAVRDTLPAEDCVYYGTPDPAALTAERIFVGFWTDRGDCDGQTALFLKEVSGQEIFLFGTAGFGGEQAYFDQILNRAGQHIRGDAPLIGGFMCQGKMPAAVRKRYENALREPDHSPNLQSMLENFDRALTHPDPADLESLKKAVLSLP